MASNGRPVGTMRIPCRRAVQSANQGGGRAATVRRLYAVERCSIEELSAGLRMRADDVARVLRYMPAVAPGVNIMARFARGEL